MAVDENFGRLAVDLGLEDRVLSGTVLADKSISEKSAVATGIVDRMLEKNWRLAVELRFGKGRPARILYDGKDFDARLAEAIQPKDFSEKPQYDTGIALLAENGKTAVIRAVAMKEGMPARFAYELLVKAGLSEDALIEDVVLLGKRVQQESPQDAYELFQRANANGAIVALYECLAKDFRIENVKLLIEIAKLYFHWDEKSERLQSVVLNALEYPEKAAECAKLLYDTVKDERISLPKDKIKTLRYLTAKNLGLHDLMKYTDDDLKLVWAQEHWTALPDEAYGIFVGNGYEGREVIPCVRRVLSKKKDYIPRNITQEHLKKALSGLPEKDYDLRVCVARAVGDKVELARVGRIFAGLVGKERRAYALLFESGAKENDADVNALRLSLIEESLKEAHGGRNASVDFGWIHPRDNKGYEQAYTILIQDGGAKHAYLIAAERHDAQKIEEARKAILSMNTPLESLLFFHQREDADGVDKAAIQVAEEYGITADLVHSLMAER
jgi:hypothetical protein